MEQTWTLQIFLYVSIDSWTVTSKRHKSANVLIFAIFLYSLKKFMCQKVDSESEWVFFSEDKRVPLAPPLYTTKSPEALLSSTWKWLLIKFSLENYFAVNKKVTTFLRIFCLKTKHWFSDAAIFDSSSGHTKAAIKLISSLLYY